MPGSLARHAQRRTCLHGPGATDVASALRHQHSCCIIMLMHKSCIWKLVAAVLPGFWRGRQRATPSQFPSQFLGRAVSPIGCGQLLRRVFCSTAPLSQMIFHDQLRSCQRCCSHAAHCTRVRHAAASEADFALLARRETLRPAHLLWLSHQAECSPRHRLYLIVASEKGLALAAAWLGGGSRWADGYVNEGGRLRPQARALSLSERRRGDGRQL